jgi:ribosomal protein S18 acetylase RimI-like enzyme
MLRRKYILTMLKTPSIAFVPAQIEDAEAIAAMGHDIWLRHYFPEVLSLDAIAYLWQRTLSPQVIRAEMARQVVYEWITLNAQIGFLAWHYLPEQRLRLSKLYLLPEYHHRGIGASALAHVKEIAVKLGAKEIFLYVFKKNHQAIRAYLRAGFTIAGEEISDAGQGYFYDDYVMRLPLK